MILFALLMGCSDVENADHHHDHNHGVATAVTLTFVDQELGDELVFSFRDDTAEPIVLAASRSYDLTVAILEGDADDEADMTEEIRSDGAAHQIFFLGDDIESPASYSDDPLLLVSPTDADENGVFIGLENVADTTDLAGTGSLNVVLRHLPPENGVAIKDETTAQTVAEEGLAAIGGANDVDVTFALEVVP